MTHQFTFGFFVSDAEGVSYEPESLEGIIDSLMTVMLKREDEVMFDSGVGAVLQEGYVDIDVAVNGEMSESAAGPLARDFVAEAIREIGGTPVGFLVFPQAPDHTPQVWHERKSELTSA